MTDRDLLLTLSSRRTPPQVAYTELLDTYGEELYRCCLLALADRGAAHVVLRDVLIACCAHIDKVGGPERLRPWLHAMAEAECARHRAATETLPLQGEAPHRWDDRLRDSAPAQGEPPARAAARPQGPAEPAGLVRHRVLKGTSGPELDGYRAHVAARADDFRGDGFPRSPGEPAPLRGLVPLLPVGLVLLGALLLWTLAGVVVATETALKV